MAETTEHACCATSSRRSATASATQLRRPRPTARAPRSTSTRASPTRARSPPSGARSRRSPACSRDPAATSTTRSPRSTTAPTASASRCGSEIARGPARGDAGGAALHHLRVATSLSRHASWTPISQQRGHLLRLPRRRGHPPRDQPRRRRAVVRRRHREGAGRLTLNPIPHIDPFGSIILPAMGALARAPGDRVGQAGAGEPEPDARPAPRHALRRPRRPVTNFALMAVARASAAKRALRPEHASPFTSASTTCPLGSRSSSRSRW